MEKNTMSVKELAERMDVLNGLGFFDEAFRG